MKLIDKLNLLNRIYNLYHEFTGSIEAACRKRCAACCTNSVIMTTLEGAMAMRHIEQNTDIDLLDRVKAVFGKDRFIPRTSTNRIAGLAAAGEDIPQEDYHASQGRCPLLTDDLCPIYAVRPFSCRCFTSKSPCGENGFAEVEPIVVTINTVFQQVIEHMDQEGFCGNLVDVLAYSGQKRGHLSDVGASGNLMVNRPLEVLMVPPNHRDHVEPLLARLRQL